MEKRNTYISDVPKKELSALSFGKPHMYYTFLDAGVNKEKYTPVRSLYPAVIQSLLYSHRASKGLAWQFKWFYQSSYIGCV